MTHLVRVRVRVRVVLQQHATADGVRQRRGGEVQGGRLLRHAWLGLGLGLGSGLGLGLGLGWGLWLLGRGLRPAWAPWGEA